MAEAVKFTFDEMFDDRAKASGAQAVAHIKKTRWTEEEIEVLKADAHAAGAAEATSAVETQATQQNAAAWEKIAASATTALANLTEVENNNRADAAKLSLEVAKKLSDALIALQPEVEINAVIHECLTHLSHEPHLVIRVAETLAQQVGESIQQAAKERGMTDKLMIVGDAELKLGDCQIEWSDGGVTRSWDELEKRASEIVGRYIETLSSDINQPANEENSHV
ncbi:MAG: hypothetical protein COA62_15455 [Rhodobiaceae bacterium]|nr:MAG: hypothetical protein COA62_15455 [Rhodobiaceae bacterium]